MMILATITNKTDPKSVIRKTNRHNILFVARLSCGLGLIPAYRYAAIYTTAFKKMELYAITLVTDIGGRP